VPLKRAAFRAAFIDAGFGTRNLYRTIIVLASAQ
jgi:hypothetical protein